jgi:hypothetical protein
MNIDHLPVNTNLYRVEVMKEIALKVLEDSFNTIDSWVNAPSLDVLANFSIR